VKIGQRISRFGAEEIWDSVIIHGAAHGDELTVRVLVCNPAWEEPQEIACIRSSPGVENPPDDGQSLNCTLVYDLSFEHRVALRSEFRRKDYARFCNGGKGPGSVVRCT
jgi:hypothetical protein